VFKRVRWYLVPSIFFGVYMFLIVFRRTSFFMEKFGLESGTLSSGPLYDLGSAFFTSAFGLPDMTVPDPDPEIQKRNIDRILGLIGITDSFMAAISAMLFIVPIASWYQAWTDGRLPKDPVYAANFFNRYVFVLILGHFMRFLSYTATVVPGPSYHCRPDFKQPGTGIAYMDLLPKNAYSIFFPSVEDMKSVSLNCGDLIFSGHMFTNVISWYYFVTYSKRVFTKPGFGFTSRKMRLLLIGVNTLFLLGCAISILASRQHYTVDILLATYIGLLLPYWYDQNLAPVEIDPYSGADNELEELASRTPTSSDMASDSDEVANIC
jgi:hypothetical protein